MLELGQKFGQDFATHCADLTQVEWTEIWTQGWMANEEAQMLADFYEGLPKDLRDRIIEKGDHPTDFEEFYAYTQETLTELEAKRPSSALGGTLIQSIQPERQEEPPDSDVTNVNFGGNGGGKKNKSHQAKSKARPDWILNRDIPAGYCWRCACEGHTQANCETRPEKFRWSQMLRTHDITKAKVLSARTDSFKPSWGGGKGQKGRGGSGGGKGVHAVDDAASDAGSTKATSTVSAPANLLTPKQQQMAVAMGFVPDVSSVSNVQPTAQTAGKQEKQLETMQRTMEALQKTLQQQQQQQPPPVQQLQVPVQQLQAPVLPIMQQPTHPFPQNATFQPPPQAAGAPMPFTQQPQQTFAATAAVDDTRVAGGEDLTQQLRPDGTPFNPDNYDNAEN